tara:strand:+ start:87 stop:608 length:522 start_codon:yes stop_codon:yes gene_type:complete
MSERFIVELLSLNPEDVVIDTERLIQVEGYSFPEGFDEPPGFHKGNFYISNIESLAYRIKNIYKNCTYKGKTLLKFDVNIPNTDSHFYFRSLDEQTDNLYKVIEVVECEEVSNQDIQLQNGEYLHMSKLNILLSYNIEKEIVFILSFMGELESGLSAGSYSLSMKYRDLIQYC